MAAKSAGVPSGEKMAQLRLTLLGSTAPATAAGAALGAWLATEKMRSEQLKRVIALVLIVMAVKTAWDLW